MANYGPRNEQVLEILAQVESLTDEQISAMEENAEAFYNDEQKDMDADIAWDTAAEAAVEINPDDEDTVSAWGEASTLASTIVSPGASNFVGDAALAVQVREEISAEDYDLLTEVWRNSGLNLPG